MRTAVVVVAALWLGCSGWRPEPALRLKCTADTNLSSYEHERVFNYGAASRTRLKGIQMVGLYRFDTEPVRNRLVSSARLYLRYAGADRKLRTLGISTVAAPWDEGDGRGEQRIGQACFSHRRLDQEPWAPGAADFAEVIFTTPGAAGYSDVRPEPDDWISLAVPPAAVQALAAGLATGLAVTDEKGQTAANNDVFSREQAGSEPYLIVTSAAAQVAAPGPIQGLRASPSPADADLNTGAVRLTFTVPQGAIGVEGTIQPADRGVPLPITPDLLSLQGPGRHELTLRSLSPKAQIVVSLTAVGPTGLRSRPTSLRVATSAALQKPTPLTGSPTMRALQAAPVWRRGNVNVSVFGPDVRLPADGRLQPELSRSRLWDGKSIVIEVARGEPAALSLCLERVGEAHAEVSVEADTRLPSRLYRLWHLKDGDWLPETCLPVRGAIRIPDPTNGIPAQRRAQVLLELPTTSSEATGRIAGSVRGTVSGAPELRIPLSIHVHPMKLPDVLGFEVSLNTYGSPARSAGVGSDRIESVAVEHAFHRLAHEHRCTLTPLGYSHSGQVEPGYAPEIRGRSGARTVADWSAWDSRFGPLLDGSAFRDCPRRSQPISHLYLPFHEAWPEDIRDSYAYVPITRDYPAIIAEHALKAGPIETMLTGDYGAGIASVVRDFIRHIRDRNWGRTAFHFYLNNKHYYKDPAAGGRGTSWWLLDEPMHRDDWLALAWFSRTMRAGLPAENGSGIVFREDVSRPQWQRDYLDGLVDLMVVNDELYARPGLIRRLSDGGRVRLWHYGSAPGIGEAPAASERWPVRAYLADADGIVPWQSIGGDANYTTPEQTALILPGRGADRLVPVGTLRLKALARGQVDVEYLRALAAHRGWTRSQVAEAVRPYLDASDYAGMRAAIRHALYPTGASKQPRIQARQSRGQVAVGRPRSPRPKP